MPGGEECPADARRVLLLGHNPGVAMLAEFLAGGYPGPYGPATIAHLSMPDEWTALQPGCARLLGMARPGETGA
ncbi:MAG: hypothetical protein ACYTGZ_19615 [Planctomycetota bacterium]